MPFEMMKKVMLTGIGLALKTRSNGTVAKTSSKNKMSELKQKICSRFDKEIRAVQT
jgi:hypothetical protein